MPGDFGRCVDAVKQDPNVDNAFAVCQASVGNEVDQNKLKFAEAGCPPGTHFCEEEGKCVPSSDEIHQEPTMENSDINGELAQSMHSQQFGEQLIDQESFVKMVNESKTLSTEGKDTVLGMAYNYYEKIFFHDDVYQGASFDNKTTQEFVTVINEVMRDYPHVKVTKEFLARKMTERGLDAMKVYEFVKDHLTIETHKDPEMYPNVTNIPPVESGVTNLTVPNINKEEDFDPNDILFGGKPRREVDESKKKRQ